MRLNRYIVASFLSHLLFLGILVAAYPDASKKIGLQVFDVSIVGHIEVPILLPQKNVTRHTEGKRLQNTYKQPAAPDTTLIPETINGEGTGTHGTKSSDNTNSDAPADKEGASPSGTEKSKLKPKSFLFDKETIEKFAKKEPHKERELSFDTSEFKHRGYMRMLKEKIESIWKYPTGAARQGISGELYIKFIIKKDGKLGEVELMRTSGHKDLDEAALKAVKDAEPYWPLPDDWDNNILEVTGHFIYFFGGPTFF